MGAKAKLSATLAIVTIGFSLCSSCNVLGAFQISGSGYQKAFSRLPFAFVASNCDGKLVASQPHANCCRWDV